MMTEKTFKVTGMGCAACADKVRAAVRGLPGTRGVKVDLAAETLSLKLDERRVSDADIRTAVEAAGYGIE